MNGGEDKKGFPQLVSPIMFYLLIIKVNPSSLKKSTYQIIMSCNSYAYIRFCDLLVVNIVPCFVIVIWLCRLKERL